MPREQTERSGRGPLQVLHVLDSLAPDGGAENRLVDEILAMAASDDRFQHAVVRLFERDGLEARLTEAGIPVEALGFRASQAGRSWPLLAWRLRRVLRRRRPDVVHSSLFTGNLVSQLAASAMGVPVVSTFNRTGELNLQRELQAGVASWKGRTMQAFGRWAARRGDTHYRAVSQYALETNCASMQLPESQASVVPRGVTPRPDADRDASAAGGAATAGRAAFGLPEQAPLFVNVARRVPEKAQHLLVTALAGVRQDLPEAQLAIAGTPGPGDEAIEAAVAVAEGEDPGLRDAVHLLGFRADAEELIGCADVFAFSSVSEGAPGVIVQALTVGTPIAAFSIAPVVELTNGNQHAWLAEPGSAELLAKAMLAAFHEPNREDHVRAGQRWAERYSLPTVARQLGDLLEARASRTKSGRSAQAGEDR